MRVGVRGLAPTASSALGFVVTPGMLLPLLLATGHAAGLTPEKLAESFIADKELAKFAKLFLAEVIRQEAESADGEGK